MSQESTTRVQLDMPPLHMASLKELKGLLEAASYAEVMRKAIKVLLYFTKVILDGGEILIKDKEGKIRPVELLL